MLDSTRRFTPSPAVTATVLCWLLMGTSLIAEESLWENAQAKLSSTDGYRVTCRYNGPEGDYQFHYVVQGDGSKILTEVLAGSARGAGAKILYDPAADKDNVKLKTEMFSLRRSLEARDIKGSMLYQSLFKQLLEQLIEPTPRQTVAAAGGHTLFFFGDKAKVQDVLEVDQAGDPLNIRRLEKGKEVQRMTFSALSWGAAAINWP